VHELGKGTFGRVLECEDVSRKPVTRYPVAIKIVRRVTRYVKAARIEADILMKIAEKASEDCRVVHIFAHFRWRDHYCLVFEPLGMSLYDFQRRADCAIHLHHLEVVARDLFACLDFLHNNCKIVHTDLKVENILLERNPDPRRYGTDDPMKTDKFLFRVKVIDFGGAVEMRHPHEERYCTISTRQYRAPEVMLGTGWSFGADIWSAACVLFELLLKDLLFPTHDDLSHLAMIERVCGPIPHFMKTATKSALFDLRENVAWPTAKTQRKEFEMINSMRDVPTIVSEVTDLMHPKPHVAEVQWFQRLMQGCLTVPPLQRLSAREAVARCHVT